MSIDGYSYRAERGLRRYIRETAQAMERKPTSTWCEFADTASAYLALDERLPQVPDRDVALVWDDRHGWAIGTETHSGEDLLIRAYYGPELLPSPAEVATFVQAVLAGRNTGQPDPPRPSGHGLRRRLAAYDIAGVTDRPPALNPRTRHPPRASAQRPGAHGGYSQVGHPVTPSQDRTPGDGYPTTRQHRTHEMPDGVHRTCHSHEPVGRAQTGRALRPRSRRRDHHDHPTGQRSA